MILIAEKFLYYWERNKRHERVCLAAKAGKYNDESGWRRSMISASHGVRHLLFGFQFICRLSWWLCSSIVVVVSVTEQLERNFYMYTCTCELQCIFIEYSFDYVKPLNFSFLLFLCLYIFMFFLQRPVYKLRFPK